MHTTVAPDMQLPAAINGDNAEILNRRFRTVSRTAGDRKLHFARRIEPFESFL
ncbi:hypothetical protein D3C73_1599460 [compost metagenome]